MENHEQLQKLIQELVETKCEYFKLAFDEEQPDELGSPASPKQIAKLEGILGKTLPSGYRIFLELHNGWGDFNGDGKLLSVEDHKSEWVKEKLQYWNDIWDEDRENPFEHGAIPILLGENKNNFLVLDPRRERENGNIDFVMFDYMYEEESYEDFTLFLQHELEVIRKLIDREMKGITDDYDEDSEE